MKALIILAQEGDAVARRELAAALAPRLRSMARHYSYRCREDYDDLLGEAWHAVFEALAVIEPELGRPEAFLVARARWRMLDYIKWSRRRSCTADEGQPEQVTDDASHEALGNVLLSRLLDNLSDTQQAVARGLMQGQTWREVAREIGCSGANVAYHIGKIRQRCAAAME